MPALWKLLRHPGFWLAVFALPVLCLGMDAMRAREKQVGAALCLRMIDGYQHRLKPLFGMRPRCRYVPNCSEYGRQAVAKHGSAKGLALAVARVSRCRKNVPPGTADLLR